MSDELAGTIGAMNTELFSELTGKKNSTSTSPDSPVELGRAVVDHSRP